MPIALAVTTSDVFSSMTDVFQLIMKQFSTTVTTISSNPLLFVAVILGFAGGLMMAGVRIMRKFGVRGMSGGRRRGRR